MAASVLAQESGKTKKFLKKPLVIEDQGSFFIGGVPKVTTYATPAPPNPNQAPAPNQITIGQMYVQFQIPANKKPNMPPVIMVHGSTHTAACLESTPDGREGWAPYFVRQGISTYIVDQAGRGARRETGEGLEARADALLHRVSRLQIKIDRGPQVDRQRQHAGVLPGAVVVQGRGPLAALPEGAGGGPVVGIVRAALQRPLVETDRLENRADGADVERLAAVRSDHHGDLLVAEAEALRASRVDQRQNLRRLRGGAQHDRLRRFAGGRDASAQRVDHRDRPEVDGLDDLAAAHLDQRDIASGHAIHLPILRHSNPNPRTPRLPRAVGVYYHARTPRDSGQVSRPPVPRSPLRETHQVEPSGARSLLSREPRA